MELKIITSNLNQLIRNSFKMDGLNGLNGFSIGFESILTKLIVFLWIVMMIEVKVNT